MDNLSLASILIALFFWISVGGILYTYFGYPLVIFLLAKLVHKSGTYQASQPPVTLLIAAYNEESVIGDKIINSLAIDYPKDLFQIIIVADGSTDKTQEIAKRYTVLMIKFRSQTGAGMFTRPSGYPAHLIIR